MRAGLRTETTVNNTYDLGEGKIACEMAKFAGANFHPIPIRQSDIADNFTDAIWHSETLCINGHGVSKYLLSRAVWDAGYKVVYTGEGCDEILGGYLHFRMDMLHHNTQGQDAAEVQRLLQQLDNANGTALNSFNLITAPLPGQGYAAYLGGILVSGGDTLYVATLVHVTWARLYYLLYHPPPYIYVIATYDAGIGNVTNSNFFGYTCKIVPRGMALSGPTSTWPQRKVKWAPFPKSRPPVHLRWATRKPLRTRGEWKRALRDQQRPELERRLLYFHVQYGQRGVLNANFIHIATSGLYGLALQGNTLYVSVFSGSAPPGVYTYNATTGLPLNALNVPLVSVNEPWGIAIEGNTLYVASYQDSAIYEFDLTKTPPQLSGSIEVSAPTNITVEPAAALGN